MSKIHALLIKNPTVILFVVAMLRIWYGWNRPFHWIYINCSRIYITHVKCNPRTLYVVEIIQLGEGGGGKLQIPQMTEYTILVSGNKATNSQKWIIWNLIGWTALSCVFKATLWAPMGKSTSTTSIYWCHLDLFLCRL